MDQETANKAATAVITPTNVVQTTDDNGADKPKKNALRIQLVECNTYEPVLLAGTNLGKTFGRNKAVAGVEVCYDIRLNMVLIIYKGHVRMIPATACTGMEPVSPADIGIKI